MGLFKKKNNDTKNNDSKNVKKEIKQDKKINNNKNDNNKSDKISLNNNKETIFEKNRRNFIDLINTEYDFVTDPSYTIIGDNTYAKGMYIGTFPESADFATFLDGLYSYGNSDISIFINPIDSETAKAELSTLRSNLAVEYIESGNSINRADDMATKEAEAKRWREEIRDGLNKIQEVSVLTTLYEKSQRDLNNSVDILKKNLGQKDIGIKSAKYCQEEVIRSNKPFNDNIFGEYHTFDKRSLACVFPFTSNNVNHENGTLMAFNKDNGLPIFYDNFDLSLKNYNMVIFAASGGGKSTFVKSMAARTSTLDIVQNISIDIEPEYNELCKTLGGQRVLIAPRTDTIMNFFDVTVDYIEDDNGNIIGEEINLSSKINSVTGIIMTMAKGITKNNPFYNDITRAIIKEIVRDEYSELGITENPESLYTTSNNNLNGDKIVIGKQKKDMPTLSSFYLRLEKASEKNSNVTYQPYYDYLIKVLADFTKVKNGDFDCFDGQSTIKLSYDTPFINFDVSRLNEDQELPIAQHIICDYIWEQMIKRNKDNKIRLIIDEAWRMVEMPEAIKFLDKGFRRGRKKNAAFWLISQQFDEFYREETKAIIKNADTKLFLPPDDTSVDRIKDVFKLTEGETAFLKMCQRGEGLMKIGKLSVKIDVDIPDIEKSFIETNQNVKKSKNTKHKEQLNSNFM